MRHARVGLGLALLLAWASAAHAQSFGKNKVHYETLEWAVHETPHLRLHYYAEEESLARRLTAFAESTCVEYDRRFRVKFRQRIPFLLYSTHHLFQQSNATPGLVSESVGGLTELIKGRVLLPHNGSWSRLKWVTRHELAHAYMLEKISKTMREHRRAQSWLPPLWWIEGLAEYCGTTWDADAEGLVRDMVTTRNAFPITRSEPITGTVAMYKEGQSFVLWLAEKYGDKGVFDLLDNVWRADDFETCFRITYGRKLADVDEEWFESLKRRYYPSVATHDRPRDIARRLTMRSRFNLGPRALAAAADSDTAVRFCYLSVNDGAVDLMLHEPRKGKGAGYRDRRILRGGGSPQFESFHLFQNRPDASPTGTLALSAKIGGRDALFLIDSRSGDIKRRLEFPNLVSISDPALAPGDDAVVFTAQDYGGRSDLWRASWPGGVTKLERLTNDEYDDVDPSVSPDGRWVAFSSDRGDYGGRNTLWRLSLAGGVPEPMSWPATGDDRQPSYSPDGRWIAFRSTRGGTSDLWLRRAEPERAARRVTRLRGPASDPDWTHDGKALLFTAQEALTFHTYRLPVTPDSLAEESETPGAHLAVIPEQIHSPPPSRYQRRLGLDLIQNGFAFDPGIGGGGAGQLAFSDVLGNEQIIVAISNDSERFGNFWDGWEGGLTYFNQSQRLNYGVGVFRLTQVYDADLDLVRREKRVGVLGLASYPLSKFSRIEGSLLVRHASDHLLRKGTFKDVDLVSNFVSFVHDNSRWSFPGPVGGTRFNIGAGFTRDMNSGEADFGTLFSEVRHYRQPIPHVVWAQRVQAQASLGADAQRYYIGGPSRLRGYERRALSGLQTVTVQEEVRFPVLRGLVLAVPALWEFPTISAAAFADGAWGWEDGEQVQRGGAGAGVYIGGGFIPAIRWNWVWRTDDFRHYPKRPAMQFSLGYNF